MTTPATFPQLGLLTLRDPTAAAAIILRWNLPKEALWTAVGLVSVIVTILSTLSNMLFPVPAPLNVLAANPFIYFLIAAGGFVATVYAVFWTGRFLGGQGRVEELMVLFLWLQALRAAAQAVVLVLLIVAPFLASFFVLFVGLATIWIFVHFINAGLRFESLVKSVVVLILGAILLIVGLSILLSMLGVSNVGVPLNV